MPGVLGSPRQRGRVLLTAGYLQSGARNVMLFKERVCSVQDVHVF